MSISPRRFVNTVRLRDLAGRQARDNGSSGIPVTNVCVISGRLRVTNQLRALRSVVPTAFILLVLASAMLTGACSKGQTTAVAAPAPPEVSVARVIVKKIVEYDEFTGRLAAVDSVQVRPRVSGYIDKVLFKEGAEVKKGDLLFVIDQRPYQAEVDRAKAELQRTQTRAELAKRERERAEKMIVSKAISQEEFDERSNNEREAAAGIASAQAAVDVAVLNLGFTRVTSPISGRVSRAEVTEGNLVSGGQGGAPTQLTTVVSQDPIWAYFDSDERVYLKHAGLAKKSRVPVFLGLANEDGYPHEGYLDFIDNQVDPGTGTIRARGVFANKDRKFTPGLFARIKLEGGEAHEAILIDDRSVGTDQDKKFVMTIGKDNTTAIQFVQLGPIVDGFRVVRGGLKPTDRIIVNGLQRVRPGTPVTVKEVAMEAPTLPSANGQPSAAAKKDTSKHAE
jgi:multidrug efflux system membrane fusion protein